MDELADIPIQLAFIEIVPKPFFLLDDSFYLLVRRFVIYEYTFGDVFIPHFVDSVFG